ncbi:MAG: YHS domain-containing protein, partial [Flavobacteriales bacterium]
MEHKHSTTGHSHSDEHLAKDPVCGMDVDPATAKYSSEYKGTTYYFCMAGCKTKFDADPAKYLVPSSGAAKGSCCAPSAPSSSSSGAVKSSCCSPSVSSAVKDPVCGMDVDPATAKYSSEYKGTTYYFCMEGCKKKFDADPAKYLVPASSPGAVKGSCCSPSVSTAVQDPVCGMDVDPATTMHSSEHEGKTYYFCSAGCMEKFNADPAKYLATTSHEAPHSCCAVPQPASSALLDRPRPQLVKDVVCGMDVDPANAKYRSEHKGKTYSCCSAICKAKFDADPAKYLASPPPSGGEHSCCSVPHPDPSTSLARPLSNDTKDPVCGMSVDPTTAKHSSQYQGTTYYFCMEGCKKKFDADPAKYLAAKKVKDLVCGMDVDPATAKYSSEHDGMPYYFCSASCKTKFDADPARYLKPVKAAAAPVDTGAMYTCPMHPQIRQVGPGSCPICGMALEPEMYSADTGPNEELIDMTRRFWIGVALTVPVVILEMGAHIFPALHEVVSPKLSAWIQFILATPVVFWCGWPLLKRGWDSVRNGHLNMFTLIAMGVGVSWVYSVVALLAPGLFPEAFHVAPGVVGVYFEAAAVITVLVLLGQVLELRARESTSGAIKALLDLAPTTAMRINAEGNDEEVALENIAVGDRLRVRPGE